MENWNRLITYYEFLHKHWKHFRSSNVVKSPFCECGGERRHPEVLNSRSIHLLDLEDDDGGDELWKTKRARAHRKSRLWSELPVTVKN